MIAEYAALLTAWGVTETRVRRIDRVWMASIWFGDFCIAMMGATWEAAFVAAFEEVRREMALGQEGAVA